MKSRFKGPARPRVSKALRAKLARVKLFLCDVDGILTDCSVFMDGQAEMKQFNVQDGLGLKLLQRHGIQVGWISGRASPATDQRAADLKVDFLRQGSQSKVEVAEKILGLTGLKWEETCFVGDDLLDLGALKRAGVSVTVPDGISEARTLADYVTQARGGQGAIREVAELILQAQHKWAPLVTAYLE
jgi:3-deoxy-D-manno-octulosonate 8-phosphate phosphatase (KDO 8-P phosphatase)